MVQLGPIVPGFRCINFANLHLRRARVGAQVGQRRQAGGVVQCRRQLVQDDPCARILALRDSERGFTVLQFPRQRLLGANLRDQSAPTASPDTIRQWAADSGYAYKFAKVLRGYSKHGKRVQRRLLKVLAQQPQHFRPWHR